MKPINIDNEIFWQNKTIQLNKSTFSSIQLFKQTGKTMSNYIGIMVVAVSWYDTDVVGMIWVWLARCDVSTMLA